MSLSEQTPPPAAEAVSPPVAPRPTSVLAILGLVFAFVFAPVGLVLSLIAIFKTGAGKAKGRGLAIAGVIISVLAIGAVVTVFALVSQSTALDPGCTDGKQAIFDSGASTDPAGLQTTVDSLRAAAAKSGDDDVRAAMNALADDYAQLATGIESGTMPEGLDAKIDADAARIDELCTPGA